MIVTCPNCSARYKINEAKIQGRGAKITCPKCAHRFVVYRDERATPPSPEGSDPHPPAPRPRPARDVASIDFGNVGLSWRVRRNGKVAYQFYELSTLQDYLLEGQIERRDQISYDGREWRQISQIPDLEQFFWDVFQRARRGEIAPAAMIESSDEDESDLPTTIDRSTPEDLRGDVRRSLATGESADSPMVGSDDEDWSEDDAGEGGDLLPPPAPPAPRSPSFRAASWMPSAEIPASQEPTLTASPEVLAAALAADLSDGGHARVVTSALHASISGASRSLGRPADPTVVPAQVPPRSPVRSLVPFMALGFGTVVATSMGLSALLWAVGVFDSGDSSSMAPAAVAPATQAGSTIAVDPTIPDPAPTAHAPPAPKPKAKPKPTPSASPAPDPVDPVPEFRPAAPAPPPVSTPTPATDAPADPAEVRAGPPAEAPAPAPDPVAPPVPEPTAAAPSPGPG